MEDNATKLGTREFALLAINSLTVMAGATISPALPQMERAFAELPDASLLVKLVMTLPALFIVLGAPIAGTLLDRGRKTPLLFACLVGYAIVGSSGFFFSHSLYSILVGRALLGLTVAGLMTGCTTLASHYFRGPALSGFMGLSAAVSSFGGVFFLLLGGLLAERGFRYPFLLYLLALVVLPLALRGLVEPERAGVDHDAPPPPLRVPLAKLVLAYALATLEIALLYMVPLHYPFLAGQLETVSSGQIGLAIATLLLVMAAVSTLFSQLAARASFAVLHGLGLALLGMGLVAIGFAPSYLATYPGLAIAGIGLGIMRPNLMVWIMSFTPPPLRGRVFGGVTTFFFLGQFASPLAAAPGIAAWGLGRTFAGAGALALLSALVFALAGYARRLPALRAD
jgi:MFS family permease